MKKLFLSAALLACASMGFAQYQMKIWHNGGTTVMPIESVDSITFIKGEEPTEPEDDPSKKGIGVFTVGEGKKVAFSRGNLQYTTTGVHLSADGKELKGTWRFAPNQYDRIGQGNTKMSESYDGWIDVFGWGTSGYDNTANDPLAIHFQPWECADDGTNYHEDNSYGYGPSMNMPDYNLEGTSANYDWGVYNAISNGGDQPGLWRTLSYEEWNYLVGYRENGLNLVSQATVNNVPGLIFLPDNFDISTIDWTPFNPENTNTYEQNVYNKTQWEELEAKGAVFLPAAGCRESNTPSMTYLTGELIGGRYWTTTRINNGAAHAIIFFGPFINFTGGGQPNWGCSVRLVQDIQ